ncbi:hypothetical protein CEP54_010611 [Fusarium duplospermum]|uniref:Allantoate permease n=1 Tax=Fusarium duplospermum TaxID=1325734 RepID=A0A428PJ49_9HYPO|nr:hypothetical protein CEP54_010611 [Fusarium duplospermum]
MSNSATDSTTILPKASYWRTINFTSSTSYALSVSPTLALQIDTVLVGSLDGKILDQGIWLTFRGGSMPADLEHMFAIRRIQSKVRRLWSQFTAFLDQEETRKRQTTEIRAELEQWKAMIPLVSSTVDGSMSYYPLAMVKTYDYSICYLYQHETVVPSIEDYSILLSAASENSRCFRRIQEFFLVYSTWGGEFKWYQVKEAFLDYKTYLSFFFYLCMNVPTDGLSAFAAQIISGLGNSPLETVLLTMPCSPFQTVASLAVAIPQKWLTNKRCLSSAICCLIPLACSILIRKLPDDQKTGQLLAYYFFYFFWGPYATVLSLPMANVAGHTKKLTVTASIFVAYYSAMIIGPQVFFQREAPHYSTGYNSLMGFEIGAITMLAAYAIGCKMENRIRDQREGTEVTLTTEEMLEDKTDYEKRGFRYIY